MPRWQFWKQTETERPARGTDEPEVIRTAAHGSPPPLRNPAPIVISPERRARRVDDLTRRRAGLLFDIEQGELAQAPENPWQEHIDLLHESLATIAADRAALDRLPPEPTLVVPALPVAALRVMTAEPLGVSFTIGAQPFAFREASDWDNRGGMVVRGDLRRVTGNPADIPVTTTDPDVLASWLPVLDSALTAFALSLRDAALAGDDLATALTFRDIIREDNEAGGWVNVHGTSNARVRRAWQRQELRGEEDRLRRELTEEQDARRTLIDRLPIARKRLSVTEQELRALDVDPDRA